MQESVAAVFNRAAIAGKRSHHDEVMLKQLGIKQLAPPSSSVQITRWLRPKNDWVKLNSDGSSKGNPGPSGWGCILRDSAGNVLWAQAEFYGFQSIMVAETKALLNGLKRCIAEGYMRVEIEADSLALVQIIQRTVGVPWSIVHEIREVWKLMQQIEFHIQHIYSESSKGGIFLANLGCIEQKRVSFSGFVNLPRLLRGIVKLDKTGLSCLRCKRF